MLSLIGFLLLRTMPLSPSKKLIPSCLIFRKTLLVQSTKESIFPKTIMHTKLEIYDSPGTNGTIHIFNIYLRLVNYYRTIAFIQIIIYSDRYSIVYY